ncbi:hypothetical protein A0257_12090 [Hymenobacter psoromatis]|nr:hypothetical protein A0257_12090 [Hymenobacter psoromatis]
MTTIIDQHQFDKYAAAWSRHVSHHQDLTSIFQQADGSQLRAVRFSFETLEYLLSTVGARRVKAQFLLKEDDKSGEKRFTLALYATDASDGRISAYYLAQYLAPVPTDQDPDKLGKTDFLGTDSLSAQIPNALVHTWLNNWKAASPVTADMFSSNYGPLTGYTFDMGDFLDSFFYASPAKTKELFVLFGLHQHYPAFPDCYALKQTFGLVLRINQLADDSAKPIADFPTEHTNFLKASENTTSHAELLKAVKLWLAENDDPIGQPFYDYSSPTPPY